MKIGLVIYGSLDIVSGGYLYDRKLTGYLRSHGDEVEIISLKQGRYFAHLLDNLTFRLPSGLDIVIEDELAHASLLAANHLSHPRHSRHQYPIISLIHNLHSFERRAGWLNSVYAQIEKQHLLSVDGFIFNSSATRQSVVRLAGDQKSFVIAPPGGDRFGKLGLEEVHQRVNIAGPLRLLFLANVTQHKGLHIVLDALARVAQTEFTLNVVGSLDVEPDYARRMQDKARGLPVPVKFHGVLHGQAVADVLKRSDVLVLPSYYEGFGIAYLEGMAHGLPAIGTNAGAIPQVITHGINGFLIEPGDSEELSRILDSLASDRSLLARMSNAALKHFATSTTWDQSAEMIRVFLLDMIASGDLKPGHKKGEP